MGIGRGLRALGLAVALAAGGAVGVAAQVPAEPRSFSIPAQPLGDALTAFGRQSGLQVSVDGAAVRGVASPGVSGAMTAEAALEALLAGTGFGYRIGAGGTVNLYRLGADAGDGPLLLGPVRVGGDAPTTATIGVLPPPYAGGQVARGGRVGFLGNRDVFDTPFSVTQYTDRLIEDQQAATIGDVLVNDPSVRSVYPRNASTDEFVIRGFTVYNREVAFNGLYGLVPFSTVGLAGMERVELLRGPSALLTGMPPEGSIGGVINVVPKRAGPEPLTRLTNSYATDSQVGAHLDVGRRFGPEDRLGVRINGAIRGGDTPIADNAQTIGSISVGVDWEGERFRLDGDLVYQQTELDAPQGLLFPGPAVIDAPDADANFFQPWTYQDEDNLTGALRAEHDLLPALTLYAAAGARRGHFDSLQTNWRLQDAAGTIRAFPFSYTAQYDALTGEAGVRGRLRTGPVDHDFTVGASWLDLETSAFGTSLPPALFSNVYDPVVGARPGKTEPDDLHKVSDVTLSSLAVADTLSILDERVQLTAGVRRQRVQARNFSQADGSETSSYDESRLTPAVGLAVKPVEELTVYANYIEGLTQGPTAPTSAVNAGEVFAPFVSKQVEMGAKLDLGSFGATLSAFQIDQPNSFTDPDTLVFGVDGNQRNRGIELMLFGEPAEGVRLLGGLAYTRGRLTETAGGANDGNTAIGVPEIQVNLGGEWDTPFLPGLTLSARALYTGAQYLDAANTQKIPDWVRLDIGARYAFAVRGTPVVLRATVENLLDTDYWATASRGGYKLGAPRTVLVSTSFDF